MTGGAPLRSHTVGPYPIGIPSGPHTRERSTKSQAAATHPTRRDAGHDESPRPTSDPEIASPGLPRCERAEERSRSAVLEIHPEADAAAPRRTIPRSADTRRCRIARFATRSEPREL